MPFLLKDSHLFLYLLFQICLIGPLIISCRLFFFNDGKRQNYHSMKNLMVNSQELCLMSKTHQQIWIISFKSIFLKSYIDISCILLPVESPHLGFFLVFCWVWRSKSGVNLQNHTFCALTFIDNSVQTIYTYICHPLSPQCGQYQLQT